jgi:hypothetical protein
MYPIWNIPLNTQPETQPQLQFQPRQLQPQFYHCQPQPQVYYYLPQQQFHYQVYFQPQPQCQWWGYRQDETRNHHPVIPQYQPGPEAVPQQNPFTELVCSFSAFL